MRLSCVLFLWCLALQLAFAAESNLTLTVNGSTYSNCTFGAVTPATVKVFHASGIAVLPLAKLSPELQQRFGYDPKKVEANRQAQQIAASKNAELAKTNCEYTVTGTCIKKHWYGWFMTCERWTDKDGGHNPEFEHMILYVTGDTLVRGNRVKLGANYDGKGTYDLEDGAGTVNVSKWIYCQTP